MTIERKKSDSCSSASGNDDEIITDRFSSWIKTAREAQRPGGNIDVPCGGCTACCTSSYFIHISSRETATISKIPRELMFPAPGLPKGNMVLGFDRTGRCPMFIGSGCSIYDSRPETCRTYDCRIFAATGLKPDDGRAMISRQASRWRFRFEDDSDVKIFSAVRAAAEFITASARFFPGGFIPSNIPQQALLAVKIYEVFLNYPSGSKNDINHEPDKGLVKAVIDAYSNFERDING